MKNPTVQVALTTMLTGMAFITCVLITGAFLPFLFIVIGAILSSKINLDDSITSPLFIVFVVVGMIISFFVLMNKLEEQRVKEKQQKLADSLR